MSRSRAWFSSPSCLLLGAVVALAACSSGNEPTTPNPGTTGGGSFKLSPCSVSGTLQLAVAQTSRVDCTNGGSTLTLAGGGASYLIVAELAAGNVPDVRVPYRLITGTPASAASATANRRPLGPALSPLSAQTRTTTQHEFDQALRARAREQIASGAWHPSLSVARNAARAARARFAVDPTPTVGSIRQFRVLSNFSGSRVTTVAARLSYAGTNVLVYLDTLTPAGGFTSSQLQAFGQLFDQTLYPIDTAAFGPPSDIDNNGHVIMLMSPIVNGLTSKAQCQSSGYIAGFFDEEDVGSTPNDPNSNFGEVFYSIVPDPNGTVSCAHSVDGVGQSVPGTYMHELEHLINFSQHAVVHAGAPEYGWLDEGLAIVAEELGSLYYEKKCPGTLCRTNPSQIFPDSSQGFIADFLYDSYQYAYLPDTSSVTLHSDSDDGFSWRGGDWLLVRWLGDQFGNAYFRKLEESNQIGIANIEAAAGQPFPVLFSNFGLSLYTDSLPGLSRTTAPAANRFTTRNVRQLWNRLFVTSQGSPDVPLASPVVLYPITTDSSTAVMDPGTMSFFRLDTPASSSTVSIQFSGPGGVALSAIYKPQLAVFRLPAGQ